MDYSIDFNSEKETIVVTLLGDYDVDVGQRAMEEVIAIRSSVERAHSIWDLTGLIFSTFDVDRLKGTSRVRAVLPARRSDERMATVVSSPLEQTIVNLLLAYSGEPPPNWRCFGTLEEAVAWCTSDQAADD